MAILEPPVFGILLQTAAEVDFHRLVRPRDLPDIARLQPVVRHLGLIAVDELLAEKAELIADGAAHGGQLHGGQSVQKARRQTAEATVAKARFRLQLKDGVLIDAQFLERLRVVVLVDEVDDVGMQRAAGEELGAKVVDLLLALRLAHAAGRGAAAHHLVAHGARHGLIKLLRRRVAQPATEIIFQLFSYGLLDLFNAHAVKLHVIASPSEKYNLL